MNQDLLNALRLMIVETHSMARVAAHMRQTFGWTCSHNSALSRLSQMLNPRDPHRFPLEALPMVIELTGLDYVSPLLARAALRAELKNEQRKPAIGVGRHEEFSRRRA